ncbi:MAG: hypothetical protein WDN30_01390 [Pararobbsia sp.]
MTSVTVIPETPMLDSASRASSSLKGLMIAVINFIENSVKESAKRKDESLPGQLPDGNYSAPADTTAWGSAPRDSAARKQGNDARDARLLNALQTDMNQLAAVPGQVTATSMP